MTAVCHDWLTHRIECDMAKDLTPEIKAEIQRVLEKFGFKFLGPDERDPKSKKVIKVNLDDTSQVNRLLEARGASIHLLCTVGSWRDTATDEETLRDLTEWNETGDEALRPEASFASVEAA
jgi:hypothetical protein